MRRLALAVLLLTACHPLDRRAPFERADYVQQHRAITQTGQEATSDRGPLRAGWAKAVIAAPDGVPLAGFGDREGVPSEGTLDPAHVRAFAVSAGEATSLIFTADLLLTSRELADSVRQGLKDVVDPRAVFFTASHTHSGPGAFMEGLVWQAVMGDFDEAALQAIIDAHVQAGRAALADLAPAKIGHAAARVTGLIKNRVEKQGPVDDEVLVVHLAKTEGGRSAAFWSYGCHAVTLPPENLRISADYPGAVAAAFEGQGLEQLGFAAGGVGSANPRHERPHDNTWLVTPLVAALKGALTRAEAAAKSEVSLSYAQARLPRPELQYRVAKELAIWSVPISMVIDMPVVDYGALTIDDLVLSFMPAEMSGSLITRAKARARRSGITLAMFPFNGTYLGYVVPRRVYNLPEEKGEDMLHYETHVVSFLGPWGGDYLMNLGLRLAGRTYAKTHPPLDPRFVWVDSKDALNKGTASRPGETETSYEKPASSN